MNDQYCSDDRLIENAVAGYYLRDALDIFRKFGLKRIDLVVAYPGKSSIPLDEPRIIRFSRIDSVTGVVTIVYEKYLRGGVN